MFISPPPKVVVVDNDKRHLDGLVNALVNCEVACRPVLYPDDIDEMTSNPHVRILFFDLNLEVGDLGDDMNRHYSNIANLISGIKPKGPYFVVLWTAHEASATDLSDYLAERLENCARPLAVRPLSKGPHLDLIHKGEKSVALIKEVRDLIAEMPQIAALLAWENAVMDATGDTVAEIARLAEITGRTDGLSKGLAILLAALAKAAVGRNNVELDRFQAVNRALMPVLADRMSVLETMSGEPNDDAVRTLWKKAFCEADLNESLHQDIAAALNRVSLLSIGVKQETGTRRGMVVGLEDVWSVGTFEQIFDVEEATAGDREFGCNGFADIDADRRTWVLIQTQAACDEAQGRAGPLPFHLGLELPVEKAKKRKVIPNACWQSPVFRLPDGDAKRLHVNVRFGAFARKENIQKAKPRYRLREQLIGSLGHHIHAYGARPGTIDFR